MCSTHYMPGCELCTPWEGPGAASFANCSGDPGPLPILAYMCWSMPGALELEGGGAHLLPVVAGLHLCCSSQLLTCPSPVPITHHCMQACPNARLPD